MAREKWAGKTVPVPIFARLDSRFSILGPTGSLDISKYLKINDLNLIVPVPIIAFDFRPSGSLGISNYLKINDLKLIVPVPIIAFCRVRVGIATLLAPNLNLIPFSYFSFQSLRVISIGRTLLAGRSASRLRTRTDFCNHKSAWP